MVARNNGAISSTYGKSALIAWFSGTDKESGIRLATQDGKKLVVIGDQTAKNAYLVDAQKTAVILWEQNKGENNVSEIGYKR